MGDAGMVRVNNEIQFKIDIISKVNDGKIKIHNAKKLLNKSIRTIERYLKEYRSTGFLFAIHKNVNKKPVNKISDDLKSSVQKLIKEKYFDFNLCHLKEKLESDENIFVNRESLRNWAHEIHHVKRAKKEDPKPENVD